MKNLSPFKETIEKANRFADYISSNEDQLIRILSKYETYGTALEEITRSKKTLRGLKNEVNNKKPLDFNLSLATFFPLNLPLYSLVLFAVMPAAFCQKVFIRTPAIMSDLIEEILDLLKIRELYPGIYFLRVSRSVFVNVYAKYCEVILFTGKYTNATMIQKACPDSLFIYNGSGLNPAVVLKNADLKLAAKKIFGMRTFNSGQDCAGTDAIFVDHEIAGDFLEYLKKELDHIKPGSYGQQNINIGQIQREEYMTECLAYLKENKKYIWHEGSVDRNSRIITPYILMRHSHIFNGKHTEFFAPLFNIIVFKNYTELDNLLNDEYVIHHSMYTSVFGSHGLIDEYSKNHRVIYNKNINDIEKGNEAYGGTGKRANFIAFGRKMTARPILINDEVYNFYSNFRLD